MGGLHGRIDRLRNGGDSGLRHCLRLVGINEECEAMTEQQISDCVEAIIDAFEGAITKDELISHLEFIMGRKLEEAKQ